MHKALFLMTYLSVSSGLTQASPSTSADSAPATPVHWHYPVPLPVVEPMGGVEQATQKTENAIRFKVRQARARSTQVLDGYARQIENCRFESTLHFDDQDRTRLIGNDQPCQGRYRQLMNEERRSLKRRISELRAPGQTDALFPVVQQDATQ